MLKQNVASLIQSGPGATQRITIDDPHPGFGADLEVVTPVQGAAQLYRTQAALVVLCDVGTEVRLECSRCLQPLIHQVRAYFEEEFRMPFSGGDPEGFAVDEHFVLDLTEAARQYLLMALPLNPLCRADCPGLCPECGAPLEGHQCPRGTADPSNPFADLPDLF